MLEGRLCSRQLMSAMAIVLGVILLVSGLPLSSYAVGSGRIYQRETLIVSSNSGGQDAFLAGMNLNPAAFAGPPAGIVGPISSTAGAHGDIARMTRAVTGGGELPAFPASAAEVTSYVEAMVTTVTYQAKGSLAGSPSGVTIPGNLVSGGQGASDAVVSPSGPGVVALFSSSTAMLYWRTPSGQVFFLDIRSSSQSWLPLGGSDVPNMGSQTGYMSVTTSVMEIWRETSKNRSRFRVYVEILEVLKERGGITPFEIAFYARLNHKRAKEFTEFLKEEGYLEPFFEDGKVVFILSAKGNAFLDGFRALFELGGSGPRTGGASTRVQALRSPNARQNPGQ